MHCKRHCHELPQNASIRNTKTGINSNKINVQLIVLPLIFDSNCNSNHFNIGLNPRHINILPKYNTNFDDLNIRSDSTQTSSAEECIKCKSKTSSDSESTKSVSTQTERMNQKSLKLRESRSTECQTIRKRNRKPFHSNNFESIETQTLESTLHCNKSLSQKNCTKICASTSTTPPKKSRKRCLFSNKLISVKKSCAFTQTFGQSCDTSTATTTQGSNFFVNNSNPMLSQMSSTNILEQSVQTEANDMSFDSEFNNIETQTVNLEMNSNNLLNFNPNEEILFSDLEFTDIETQTIWNNDRTTQTDEHLEQLCDWNNDVILRYLDNDSGCDISNRTLFAEQQTQT